MIRMSEEAVRAITIDAEQTYPEECCGMLLGMSSNGGHTVTETAEIENRQEENRRRRFLITPEQYRFAEETARRKGLELLGFYHSHPDHPAAPSDFDREHALPWFSYVIIGVNRGRAGELTAWLLDESHMRFVERMVVIDRPSQVQASGAGLQSPGGNAG